VLAARNAPAALHCPTHTRARLAVSGGLMPGTASSLDAPAARPTAPACSSFSRRALAASYTRVVAFLQNAQRHWNCDPCIHALPQRLDSCAPCKVCCISSAGCAFAAEHGAGCCWGNPSWRESTKGGHPPAERSLQVAERPHGVADGLQEARSALGHAPGSEGGHCSRQLQLIRQLLDRCGQPAQLLLQGDHGVGAVVQVLALDEVQHRGVDRPAVAVDPQDRHPGKCGMSDLLGRCMATGELTNIF
jgi:hypothetical protein